MGAGTRPDHQTERILDLAVQPYDASQATEDLTLATFAQHRRQAGGRVHAPTPGTAERRASENLYRNWAAFTA